MLETGLKIEQEPCSTFRPEFFYKLIYEIFFFFRFRVGDGKKSSENDQLTDHFQSSFI